jgi:hypothetical protein
LDSGHALASQGCQESGNDRSAVTFMSSSTSDHDTRCRDANNYSDIDMREAMEDASTETGNQG